MGFLVGACYGGFINSRVAYVNFMERNQATAFKSSFEAKVVKFEMFKYKIMIYCVFFFCSVNFKIR